MKEELKKLGLTDGEAKTYLSLLKLGTSKVGPIVKDSGVSYSKIYEVLNRLIEKGFVSYIIKEKTKYFQAVRPSRLKDYIMEKQKELENNIKMLLPQLEKLEEISHKKQEAEIFVGFSGLKTAYKNLLRDYDKNETLLFFYVHDESSIEVADLFYKQEFHYFKELGLKLKGISTQDFKQSKYFKLPPAFIKLKFVNFPLPSTIDIYRNKVLFISWREKPVAYLINSVEIAENYKKYFYDVWKLAKK